MIEIPFKIAIIDDDESILIALELYLKQLDPVEVVLYSDPIKAMKEIEEHNFSIVITDLLMPDITGVEILEHCTSLQKGIHVIVISSDHSLEAAQECFSRGARCIISKPIQKDDVLTVVKSSIYQLLNWKYTLSERKPRNLVEKIKNFRF